MSDHLVGLRPGEPTNLKKPISSEIPTGQRPDDNHHERGRSR
ncbi:hypothetical protein [Adhaeribacter radiodurans]|nr:hypothetical protein [Adhaeribacter radiodurans]